MSRCFASAALLAALASFGSAACGTGAARFPTSDPALPARPALSSAALELEPPLPPAARHASSEAPLAVLLAPVDDAAVESAIERFFRAVTFESAEALDALLTEQAWLDGSAGRQPARAAWSQRFSQLDYGALRGVPLFRERDLETYRAREAAELRGTRLVPNDLKDDDVFVRVHLTVVEGGKTRLFADEIRFVLRPSSEGYKIARMSEDFRLP